MTYDEVFREALKQRFSYSFAEPNENTKPFHVGYGIDGNYVRCMGVSITSICRNNPHSSFVFHVISSELTQQHLDKIKRLAQTYRIDIYIYIIDTARFNKLPTQEHFPISMYYRLILPLLLKEGILLYLDADVFCLQNIEEILQISLDTCAIAAVPDIETTGGKRSRALGLGEHIYFNSGVLLININKWNEENILGKLMEILLTKKKDLQYPDQDALNIVFSGKVFYLSQRWNRIGIINEPDAKEKLQETKLLHFTAHPKPWSVLWPHLGHELLKDIYSEYEAQSPWRDEPLVLPANYKHMKWYAQALWREGNYKLACKWYLKYLHTKFAKRR